MDNWCLKHSISYNIFGEIATIDQHELVRICSISSIHNSYGCASTLFFMMSRAIAQSSKIICQLLVRNSIISPPNTILYMSQSPRLLLVSLSLHRSRSYVIHHCALPQVRHVPRARHICCGAIRFLPGPIMGA